MLFLKIYINKNNLFANEEKTKRVLASFASYILWFDIVKLSIKLRK